MSFRAHGLHTYLLSFPPDWHFDLNWIADRVKDGISAIRTAINELISFGYVRRVIRRSPSGQFSSWDYEVYERPLPIDPFPKDRKIQEPEPVEQLSLAPATEPPQPLSGLPQMGEPFMGDRTHINNEFHEEEFKKDLSLSAPTKNEERENFENFSNHSESPAKTSVESRNQSKSRGGGAWANLDETFKNFCWQQVGKLPNRPADPIAWILSRLEHLEAEYHRLYPQTASPDSRYAEWEAILTDPFKGMTHLLTVGIDQTSPEYEERYQFAVAYQRRRR
ncbi:hypothetical protein [Pseudanabaena sp. PCC 6802]|uniref:hypothetical protein n=1 Tax=Pseudanabaena sp. PCC 6802 TaxID=118173 RepID=UPI0003478DBC|nr:hypothetical protein [Pseudanabaena sp. PCC 6802]